LGTLPSIITVDGPAGSGKSSVCFAVATDLGYLFVDTGAFYRAITLATLRTKRDDADEPGIAALAQQTHIDIAPGSGDRQYTVLMDGEDITEAIRDPKVEAAVSRVSALRGVRATLQVKQREFASRGQVIMAGRDIGTVVLPHADLKIYLDASVETRAMRRYRQRLANGESADYEAILMAMRHRDGYDSTRSVDPLRKADDAFYLNTDHMSIEQAIERMEQHIRNWPNDSRVGDSIEDSNLLDKSGR
jgi:cytidylate kinase